MQRNQQRVNNGGRGGGRVGRIRPSMFHPIHYRVMANGPLGAFVSPCTAPALPARPEMTFQCIQDTAGGVPMTALKSSHPPAGMPVAPLAYKCIGCGRIPCRYMRPAELTDPENPTVIDWGLVELGTTTLEEVPAVFVVAYAYVNPLQ